MEAVFDMECLIPLKKSFTKFIGEKLQKDKIPSSFVPFLKALTTQEFKSQQELSEYVSCNKAHTSRTLIKMQLSGLVRPTCFKNTIELTEKGKAYAEKVSLAENEFLDEIFSSVTEKEKDTFNKVIQKMLSQAKKEQ